MNPDPLAAYRRVPLASATTPPPAEPEQYMAFGSKDRVHRLRIRSLAAPVNAPGYNILLNVIYDGQHGTHFLLVYSVLMVRVQGRNLQKVIYAIENEKADFIQEFDPERWPQPADAIAPFIESIEIKVVESSAANTEATRENEFA